MREWPEYDFDLLIHKWGLVDKPCWAGVDASWTTDLTAVVFVFPPSDGGETWTLLPFFWMPQERVAELERVCRVPHSTWIRQGFIEATAGNGIDMRAVKQRIHWGRELFELREMPSKNTTRTITRTVSILILKFSFEDPQGLTHQGGGQPIRNEIGRASYRERV